MNRLHLTGVLVLFVAIYGAILLLAGIAIDIGALRYLSIAVGAVGLAVAAFEHWLWKVPALHPWLVPTPNVSGTWHGQLGSSHDGPIASTYRECFLVIRQTFSRVSVVLLTAESESHALSASIYRESADGQTLAVIYQNAPRLRHRERSPIHLGGMILHIRGDSPSTMDGEYFTSRSTVGEVEFRVRASGESDTFEEAKTQFGAR